MQKLKIDNLKCCGNCKHRDSYDFGTYYSEECKISLKASYQICQHWEFDNFDYFKRF